MFRGDIKLAGQYLIDKFDHYKNNTDNNNYKNIQILGTS